MYSKLHFKDAKNCYDETTKNRCIDLRTTKN